MHRIYPRFFPHFWSIYNRSCHNRRRFPHTRCGSTFLPSLINLPENVYDIHDTDDDRRLTLTNSPCLVLLDEQMARGNITPSCPRAPLQPRTTPSIPPTPNPSLNRHPTTSSVIRGVRYVEYLRPRLLQIVGRPMSPAPTSPGEMRWPTV
jgi:hypothetical protein